jgi:hypothetical protein
MKLNSTMYVFLPRTLLAKLTARVGLLQRHCWPTSARLLLTWLKVKRTIRQIKEAAAKEINGGKALLDDPGFQAVVWLTLKLN